MLDKFARELQYRGEQPLETLSRSTVVIAGAGALGSNLAMLLVRQGFQRIRLIDDDRVEESNLGTQIYGVSDIGAMKVQAAQNIIYRAVEVEIDAIAKRLSLANVKKFSKGATVVVDAFDNSQSRQILHDHCLANGIPCLHVGLFEGYGEVVWDSVYRVPEDVDGDICEYPMARNLVNLVVAIAAEELVDFLTAGQARKQSHCVTLGDLKISAYV